MYSLSFGVGHSAPQLKHPRRMVRVNAKPKKVFCISVFIPLIRLFYPSEISYTALDHLLFLHRHRRMDSAPSFNRLATDMSLLSLLKDPFAKLAA